MPRWASRIILEVTDIRVDRLQDISEKDAKAEGAPMSVHHGTAEIVSSYRDGFENIWNSINGSGSWAANPYVWVIEFKRLEVQLTD